MPPEDRHRIEQNELALWLGKVASVIRPYARPLAWAVILVIVLWLAVAIWRSTSTAAAARASEALSRALLQRSPTALEDVARQYRGSVGELALIAAADLYFAGGAEQLFLNKIVARQDLQKALELYREVERRSRSPDIRARAMFGIARTLEALAGTPAGQGLLREAVEKYRELERAYPTSPYAFLAQDHLRRLESDELKRFYDLFAKFDPRPELLPEPSPATGSPLGEPAIPQEPPLGESADQAQGGQSTAGDQSSPAEDETQKPAGELSDALPEIQTPQSARADAAGASSPSP